MADRKEISFRVRHEVQNEKVSKISRYCDLIIGSRKIIGLIKFEVIMLISSWIPGALGLFLRSKLFPLILKECGKGVVFGTNVNLRHSGKISIGDNVIIDDNVMLDAKGDDNKGIFIGSGSFIGRNTILSSKNGDIYLDDNVNIGFNSYLFSGSSLRIGKDTLIAAYTYLIGGDHGTSDTDETFYEQECPSRGISVGDNCWIGAHADIQDGVDIGANSLIGTKALVNRNIPEYSIAVGIPAKVIRDRRESNKEEGK